MKHCGDMLRSIILFAFLFNSYALSGQLDLPLKPMDDIKISLLTCDPGDQLYSTFGHSAIRVLNERTGQDVIYNYGTFDTDTPGFYIKFLRGKLPYRLSKTTYASFLYEYNYFKRGVKELVLNLGTKQELEMIAFLETNYLPENRNYPYDFFFDNCATRIRDIIPVINSNVEWQSVGEDKTFRQMLHQFLPGMPWSEFGIDLIIGSVADQIADREDQMFLPGYLHKHFEAATISENAKLTKESYRVLIFDEEAKERMEPRWFTPHIIFGLLILLEIVIFFFLKRKSKAIQWYNRMFFFSIGLASLLMMGLWFLTEHQATGNNWNILWASPLYLFFPWMKRSDLKKKMGYFLIGLAGISLINIYFQYLPQYFNPYNTLLLLLLMYKVWKCVTPMRKTA